VYRFTHQTFWLVLSTPRAIISKILLKAIVFYILCLKIVLQRNIKNTQNSIASPNPRFIKMQIKWLQIGARWGNGFAFEGGSWVFQWHCFALIYLTQMCQMIFLKCKFALPQAPKIQMGFHFQLNTIYRGQCTPQAWTLITLITHNSTDGETAQWAKLSGREAIATWLSSSLWDMHQHPRIGALCSSMSASADPKCSYAEFSWGCHPDSRWLIAIWQFGCHHPNA